MKRFQNVLRLFALGAGACLTIGSSAQAVDLKHVYSFCAKRNCADGKYPVTLVSDPSGNLFGLTQIGGRHQGTGTIFELVGGKNYKLLYTFCKKRDCSDGRVPTDLLIDTDGNLYGTTFQGGPATDDGLMFKLSHNEDGSVWTYEVLYAFCAQGGNACTDGSHPNGLTYAGRASGAPYDGTSPLYGTAMDAFTTYRSVAFKLTPPGGARTAWTESVIYGFCASGLHCPDGDSVDAAPIMDASGNLYGVTEFGGTHDSGVVYQLSPGGGGTWTQTTLYTFCTLSNCADGAYPAAALAFDAAGNLYGTAQQGGVNCNSAVLAGMTCGVVFKVVPNGASSTETVLHAFCVEADCGDGAEPFSTPLIDGAGRIFGTTFEGGGNDVIDHAGSGVLFEIDNAGYHVLHHFCAKVGCRDGAGPAGGFLPDGAGGILGVTFTGGPDNGGLIYRAMP